LKWVNGVDAKDQPRFARNEQCKYWKIFEGINDWKVISLRRGEDDGAESEFEEMKSAALEKISEREAGLIEDQGYGAIATEDEDEKYYIVRWEGLPYTDQDSGDMVCDATYLYKVPNARYWYHRPTPEVEERSSTVVYTSHILAGSIDMLPVSDSNQLPSNLNATTAADALALDPLFLGEDSHTAILEEAERREAMDKNIEYDDDSDDEQDIEIEVDENGEVDFSDDEDDGVEEEEDE
jgi:hypothetical protein